MSTAAPVFLLKAELAKATPLPPAATIILRFLDPDVSGETEWRPLARSLSLAAKKGARTHQHNSRGGSTAVFLMRGPENGKVPREGARLWRIHCPSPKDRGGRRQAVQYPGKGLDLML